MEFTEFNRKPFKVQAVEITAENMEEVAQFIGTVKTKGDLTFIALDRRLVPNVSRAYVGWWFTILDQNYRCYAPKVFHEQFIEQAPASGIVFDEEAQATPVTSAGDVRPYTDSIDNINEATPVQPGAFDVV